MVCNTSGVTCGVEDIASALKRWGFMACSGGEKIKVKRAEQTNYVSFLFNAPINIK